jgi:hypothetical protein
MYSATTNVARDKRLGKRWIGAIVVGVPETRLIAIVVRKDNIPRPGQSG